MGIRRERRERVEIVTIDRPEARNAIDHETAAALDDAFDELTSTDAVWAVIITGSGERAFCAGMDLKVAASGKRPQSRPRGGFAGMTRRDFPKPLIAAVNGFAVGGGCEIALACDIIIAAEHASFGLPEVKRGILAAAGGLIRLPKAIPSRIAFEMGMTGESIDAERAYQLGLVNRVVPADRLIDEALEIANRICGNAPIAVRTSKRIMRGALDLPESEAWELSAAGASEVMATEDAREGPRAFAEKRLAVWQGR